MTKLLSVMSVCLILVSQGYAQEPNSRPQKEMHVSEARKALVTCGGAFSAFDFRESPRELPMVNSNVFLSCSGKNILLYTTRYWGNACCVMSSGFDENLPALLRTLGFNITVTDRVSVPFLTSSILANYDQLWFVSSEQAGILNPSEIQAITAFHRSGKGILIIGDSGWYDGPANQISSQWGIIYSGQYSHCASLNGCTITDECFAEHEIWNGVDSIQANVNEGTLTASPPSQIIASHNGINMVAVRDDEYGRIAWDATVYRFTDASCAPDLSISACDNAQYALNVARWLSNSPAPARVVYSGPIQVKGDNSSCVLDEIDQKITAGDNIHLRLPFKNISSKLANIASIRLCGIRTTQNQPLLSFYNGAAFVNEATYYMSNLSPCETRMLDVWMHVQRIDPASMADGSLEYPQSTYLEIVINDDPENTYRVPVIVEKIAFEPQGPAWALDWDCLHHPDNIDIRRYAQYAAGNKMAECSHANDPEDQKKAVQNTVHTVSSPSEFVYCSNYSLARSQDVDLLQRRGASACIGTCSEYSDLMIGLLRSLNIPTRAAYAYFNFWERKYHQWNEAYIDGTWVQADATSDIFDQKWPSIYHGNEVYADVVSLPNTSRHFLFSKYCHPECYNFSNYNCMLCGLGGWKWDTRIEPVPFDECLEDVTSLYLGSSLLAGREKASALHSDSLAIETAAPKSTTLGATFRLRGSVANEGSNIQREIHVLIGSRVDALSEDSLYASTPWHIYADSLLPNESFSFESDLVPLYSGQAVPLVVYAFSLSSSAMSGLFQSVNEPGTLPDLTQNLILNGTNFSPEDELIITSRVLNDTLGIVDNSQVLSIIESVANSDYSMDFEMSFSPSDSCYYASFGIPESWPVGLYKIESVAMKEGYEADTTTSYVTIGGQPRIQVATVRSYYSADDVAFFAAQLVYQDACVISADVQGEVQFGGTSFIMPFEVDSVGEQYTMEFKPADLSSCLGNNVLPDGIWKVKARAAWHGSNVADSLEVTVNVPDLSIEAPDIWIDPPSQRMGDTIMAHASIINRGSATCEFSKIRFIALSVDNESIQLNPDRCVNNIEPNDTQVVDIKWQASDDFGNWQLCVVIDPENSIIEVDKSNNGASRDFIITSIDEQDVKGPSHFALKQNYPNPFNPLTTIEYEISRNSYVSIRIYSVNGLLIRSLVEERKEAGKYAVVWEGTDERGNKVSSGIYLCRLTAEDFVSTRKFVLLK